MVCPDRCNRPCKTSTQHSILYSLAHWFTFVKIQFLQTRLETWSKDVKSISDNKLSFYFKAKCKKYHYWEGGGANLWIFGIKDFQCLFYLSVICWPSHFPFCSWGPFIITIAFVISIAIVDPAQHRPHLTLLCK